MSRRSGLGRGLAALIPPTQESTRAAGPSDGQAGPSVAGPRSAAKGPTSAANGPDAAEPERGHGLGVEPEHASRPRAELPDAPVGVSEDHEDHAEAPERNEVSSSEAGSRPDGARTGASTVGELRADEGALQTSGPQQVSPSAATLAEVRPSAIDPNPRQPREVFDPEELAGLATSLQDLGVLQPLVVRDAGNGRFELVAGERRLRAALLAGLDTVPVVVRHTEDADLLKEALVENIHRVQLNPLEEGAAYQQLLEEFGVTQEELASRLGRSRPAISNAIRMLQLPIAVQRRVAAGVLSAGHAKVLLGLDDPEAQTRLAERIVVEGMSVRATEELVRLGGAHGDPPRRSRRGVPTPPGLVELQDDLSDALEARVRISMGATKGRLAIDFTSVEDLERIVSIIADGLQPRPGPVEPTPRGG